jgi:mannan endo-1,4-beta-mannosidase
MKVSSNSKILCSSLSGLFLSCLLGVFILTCNTTPSKNQFMGPWEFTPLEPSPNKQRLLNYLSDQYGKNIISGQMDTSWTVNREIDMIARVFEDTGKFPAIKGFDFIQLHHIGPPHHQGMAQLDEAIEWWEGKNRMNGRALTQLLPDQPDIRGIVTFCWHWRVFPSTSNHPVFSVDETSFRIPWKNGKLDVDSKEFKTLLADMDRVAHMLSILRDRDIPVLWRPLHEAAGNWGQPWTTGDEGAWFWWGASGPEPYIALWEFMYGYFTYEKELNNLIWVWNGQNKDWFPNPATVELVGNDIYPRPGNPQDYNSLKAQFDNTILMIPEPYREKLMVALTENGPVPDPDRSIADDAMWSFFMVWNDGDKAGVTSPRNQWSGEYFNTQAHKMHVYHHPNIITLDKLPDLTKYRLD